MPLFHVIMWDYKHLFFPISHFPNKRKFIILFKSFKLIKLIAALLDYVLLSGMVVPKQDIGESIFALTHYVFCSDKDLFPNWSALFFLN